MNVLTAPPSDFPASRLSPDSASPPRDPTSSTPACSRSRRETAALLLNPALQAVATIDHCQPFRNTNTDFGEVFEELEAITAAVTSGDMKHPEGIAIAQATALNIMFGRLSGLALANYQSPHFDSLMRLALRAQSQSGRTLETLATLRNPAIFAQQVNVAHQQIVANAPVPAPPSVRSRTNAQTSASCVPNFDSRIEDPVSSIQHPSPCPVSPDSVSSPLTVDS